MNIEYISWDPGEGKRKSIGMTKWDEKGQPVEIKAMTQLELDDELDRIPNTVKIFIIEEFRVYGKKHIGSKLLTIQVIGQLKAYARKHNIEVVELPASLKRMAAMYAQVEVPDGHMPDTMASYLIGYYYLHNKGIIPAKVLEEYK